MLFASSERSADGGHAKGLLIRFIVPIHDQHYAHMMWQWLKYANDPFLLRAQFASFTPTESVAERVHIIQMHLLFFSRISMQ